MRSPLIIWMLKREVIRKAKEAGHPWPWTDDPILRGYRFCNVRRRDDRVSRWIIKHVIPYQDHPQFLEFLALCRWVNWPPTIKEILDDGHLDGAVNWNAIINTIDAKTARREKAWTGAYMIRADNDPRRSKADYIVKDVVLGGIAPMDGILRKMFLNYHTRQSVWAVVEQQKFWGSFMAGQFVDDLTWTKFLNKPRDDATWAPMGPGSRRGFCRLLGWNFKKKPMEDEWQMYLMRWHAEAIAANREFADLTLMDIQNCLCEYDKYERVRLGEGRPRSTYKPETAYQV